MVFAGRIVLSGNINHKDPMISKFQEFSSTEVTAPGSPDDLFLKDLNPCLTPYSTKTKSKVNSGLYICTQSIHL